MDTCGPIPEELLSRCLQTIAGFHEENGIGDLSKRLASRRNLRALGMVPGGSEITSTALDAFKLRLWTWFAGVLAVALSSVYGGWPLLGLLPLVLIDRWLETKQQRQWQSAAAILFALEILANDYAGWGCAYPQARKSAGLILQSEFDKSEWLRHYRRNSELGLIRYGQSASAQLELIREGGSVILSSQPAS